MNASIASTTQSQQVAPCVAEADARVSRNYPGLLASLGFVALLSLAQSDAAFAATAPPLGSTSTYGIVSQTYNNTNTAPQTIINGTPSQPAVCGTTLGLPQPLTIVGTTVTPCNPLTVGVDQNAAVANLNAQANAVTCTVLAPGTPLEAIIIGANPPGTFPPGCYTSAGAMDITASRIVTLSGAGVYIFRPGGALTTGQDSSVVLAGACAADVFWAPVAAATIGANTAPSLVTPTFQGNILAAAGISIGHFANVTGRALAFGGTVLTDANTITVPTCAPFVAPAVALSKAFLPASISPGGVSTLTVTLNNPNVAVATLTAPLIDTLPGGVVIAATPNAATTCGGAGAPVAVAGGTTVTLPAGRSIPANGSCTLSVNVTAAAAGSYINTLLAGALVTSNGNNLAPASATLTVGASAPTLSTVASPSVALGASISDTATLIGGAAPTGTITFNLFGPNDATCTGAVLFTSIVPVNTNGSYTSTSFTPLVIGTYRWIANYGGDANNAATANTCNAPNESADVTAAAVAVPIPTLSEWAMILLAGLLALAGFAALRKQEK